MAADLELYRDREQSFIKHQFLTKYLQAAAFKTLQGHSSTFNFVDAFAGPWKISDDAKYSDASFDQAINTLEDVRVALARRGISGLKIRFCFCERRRESVARLRAYAASKGNFEIHVFEGAFEDNLDDIAATLPNGFTFTFIDPTGWNIRNKKVFSFLRTQDGEFLLNFMSDHINRHAEYDEVEASFGRFLADAQWAREFSRLPADWGNERKMLFLLKEAMRARKIATYLPDFSIMVPRKERVKMRLILGTKSPKGLAVFRDVQEKVEKQEMEVRHSLREGDTPQASLFPAEYIAEMLQEQKGVGCKANCDLAEKLIVEMLQGRAYAYPGVLYNAAMESVPIRGTHLNKLLLSMRDRGIVAFDLPDRKKVPQPDTRIALSVRSPSAR